MKKDTAKKPQHRLPYRESVGIMVINATGLVWTGRRIPKWEGDRSAHVWQMPQGGIEKGEKPRDAAVRELREETGITSVEIIGELPQELTYDLPKDLLGIALKGKYAGQRQKWFAMRFTGSDDEINIHPNKGKAEFDLWMWRPARELPDLIVSFKRDVYQEVVRGFAHLTNA